MDTENFTIEYLDNWVAGWNLNRCAYTLQQIEEQNKENNDYWKKHKKTELINDGLIDGWLARRAKVGQEKTRD